MSSMFLSILHNLTDKNALLDYVFYGGVVLAERKIKGTDKESQTHKMLIKDLVFLDRMSSQPTKIYFIVHICIVHIFNFFLI